VAELPDGIAPTPQGCLAFCTAIVDAVADRVCAFKPQAAHFAALGAENELASLIAYIHERHPGIPVILDAKRGDIGSTAALYAQEAYVRYDADAVTVSPFLGLEGLAPFLAHGSRGVVVLCRTSNPDSSWLQQLRDERGEPAYLKIARAVQDLAATGNAMLVAGATYPDELREIRRAAPDVPLLVPGVGAQGGDVDAVIKAGLDARGAGLAINASRSILYASRGPAFAEAARAAATALVRQMDGARQRPRN
jgi:orotidine-5'-phosphate decarboxylase